MLCKVVLIFVLNSGALTFMSPYVESHSLVKRKKYLSLQVHGSFNATNNEVLL